jgi:hypothetical protein
VTGYLKPPLNLLYPHEKLFLSSAYCSICKNLSKRKLYLNRILLNYDSLFFYTLFTLAIPNYKFSISPFFCRYTLTNRYYLTDNGLLDYFSDYSSLFSSLKFLDDYLDENPAKSKFSYILFKFLNNTLKYISHEEILNSILSNENQTKSEMEKLIEFIQTIIPLDYINYSFRKPISIVLSNLIKLLFYIDAIDDFEQDLKSKKQNILFELPKTYSTKTSDTNNIKTSNIKTSDVKITQMKITGKKLKDNFSLLEEIKKECTFSLNLSLDQIDMLPNKDFSHIIKTYFTDLIPFLLDKVLLKNNCNQIFCKFNIQVLK